MAFLSPLQEMRVDVNVIVYQRVVLQLWLKSTSEDAKGAGHIRDKYS